MAKPAISFYLTAKEHRAIVRAAKREELSISAWVLRQCLQTIADQKNRGSLPR